MSERRRHRRLLRVYPRAWRERYGEELEELLLASGDGGRIGWRARADVVRGGLAERLRAWGVGAGVPPSERARAGVLIVLVAWVAFVLAGARVQKLSEHWQNVLPLARRGLPDGAFHTLLVAATLGGVLVLAGVAVVLPRVVSYLRGGGWPASRRPLLRAAIATTPALAAFVAIAIWARRLGVAERNGADAGYSIAFAGFAVLAVVALACWTAAAVSIARRLALGVGLLRIEALLAGAVSASMLAMTVATALWWGTVARVAPWFLQGEATDPHSAPFSPQMLGANTVMLLATCLSAFGAWLALSAVRRLPGEPVRG